MTAVPVRSVAGVLARLDSDFHAFSQEFTSGDYALWLGSAISHDRLPDLWSLITKVLEHMRERVDHGDDACKFRQALLEALGFASLTSAELSELDINSPVAEWPNLERILGTLTSQYSKVLNVRIEGFPSDYLIWTALDVPGTYGGLDPEPDVEHLCLAVLMLEGLVTTAATANWDGLVEAALRNLAADYETKVRVAVRATDFRSGRKPIELIKFHGCAVLARSNEEDYRDLLIGRSSQISGWTEKAENSHMRKRLETIYSEQRTLMIGLSTQDANLQTIYARAAEDLPRPWPDVAPALVLAEESLQPHHRELLEATYKTSYDENQNAIASSSILGSYAKPTLMALLLFSITAKFETLTASFLKDTFAPVEVEAVTDGIRELRTAAANQADSVTAESTNYDAALSWQRSFVQDFITTFRDLLSCFRSGQIGSHYQPLSDRPIARAIGDVDYPTASFARLGAVLGALGLGQREGAWSVQAPSRSNAGDAILKLRTRTGTSKLFLFRTSWAYARYQADGASVSVEPRDIVVIADDVPEPAVRSSRARYGRTMGSDEDPSFSMAAELEGATTADDLLQSFRLAAGL